MRFRINSFDAGNTLAIAAVVIAVFALTVFLLVSRNDSESEQQTDAGESSKLDFVSSGEFTVPDSWRMGVNSEIGASLYTPSEWSGGNVSGPVALNENDEPVMQYEISSSSSAVESEDGTTVEVRVSTPASGLSCTPLHVESIQIKALDDESQLLFCESASASGKVDSILVSDSTHEVGTTYDNIDLTLNNKQAGIRVALSNLEDQDDQQQKKYREYSLRELLDNEDVLTALNVVRSLDLLANQ